MSKAPSLQLQAMVRTALMSPCGLFRLSLTRTWDASLPRLVFIMLNPSKANASIDDPTVRRCIGFAQALGYGSIEIVNLYAYRATNPIDLKKAGFPVGEGNDAAIVRAVARAGAVVCAWGANARALPRAAEVLDLIELWCTPQALAWTADGIPKHPLYLPGNLRPVPLTSASAQAA